ncbi:MAG: hypothetical protein HC908_19160 [Calothrix sp. SM1_7_51]|nr:hypothetical protein [Calothrix sp. SM1_7_51]
MELRYLKNISLSNTYKYLTGLYLARVTSYQQLQIALNKLWNAIYLNPKVLFERIIQRYLLKIFVMLVFSPKLAKIITKPVGNLRIISDPRN